MRKKFLTSSLLKLQKLWREPSAGWLLTSSSMEAKIGSTEDGRREKKPRNTYLETAKDWKEVTKTKLFHSFQSWFIVGPSSSSLITQAKLHGSQVWQSCETTWELQALSLWLWIVFNGLGGESIVLNLGCWPGHTRSSFWFYCCGSPKKR